MRDNDLMQVQDPDSESLKVLIAVFALEMNATRWCRRPSSEYKERKLKEKTKKKEREEEREEEIESNSVNTDYYFMRWYIAVKMVRSARDPGSLRCSRPLEIHVILSFLCLLCATQAGILGS